MRVFFRPRDRNLLALVLGALFPALILTIVVPVHAAQGTLFTPRFAAYLVLALGWALTGCLGHVFLDRREFAAWVILGPAGVAIVKVRGVVPEDVGDNRDNPGEGDAEGDEVTKDARKSRGNTPEVPYGSSGALEEQLPAAHAFYSWDDTAFHMRYRYALRTVEVHEYENAEILGRAREVRYHCQRPEGTSSWTLKVTPSARPVPKFWDLTRWRTRAGDPCSYFQLVRFVLQYALPSGEG